MYMYEFPSDIESLCLYGTLDELWNQFYLDEFEIFASKVVRLENSGTIVL